MKYVLITPAKNEADNIGKTIESVISQTHRPEEYVIVSDGSTDNTDNIIKEAVKNYPFITYIRNESPPSKDFSSKVHAFNIGKGALKVPNYEFIGNLDADVTFDSDYFVKLLEKFKNNPKLGLAGGHVHELVDGILKPFTISNNSVSGAVQLFRKTCFEDIDGYIPNKTGGIDSAAEITARAKGWHVQTFRELKVLHHGRMLTGAKNIYNTLFRSGVTKYRLGYHPLFHTISCVRRIVVSPYFFGSCSSFAGFISAYFKKENKIISSEAIRFLRREQIRRLFKL